MLKEIFETDRRMFDADEFGVSETKVEVTAMYQKQSRGNSNHNIRRHSIYFFKLQRERIKSNKR